MEAAGSASESSELSTVGGSPFAGSTPGEVSGKGPLSGRGLHQFPGQTQARAKPKWTTDYELCLIVLGLMSPPVRPLDPGQVATMSLNFHTWMMGHEYRTRI